MTQELGRSALKFSPAPDPARRKRSLSAKGSLEPAAIALAALLIVAVLFGGGGVRYGFANLVVQLTALAVLAFNGARLAAFWKTAPAVLKLMVALTIAIPVIQLIPLPTSIWSALPGRQLAVDAREAAGVTGWAPITLDRARTTVALTGLIVPLTLLAIGWTVSARALAILTLMVAALAALMLVPGIPQVMSANGDLSLYAEQPMGGVLFGSFANRNSAGLFLVAGLAFAALVPAPVRHPLVLPSRLALCALIVLAIVLTKSRTALVLATLPLIIAAAHVVIETRRASIADGKSRAMLVALGAGALIAVAAASFTLTSAPGRLGDTLERFASKDDPRTYIWEDTAYAAERYWPVGSGMGTFDEVFQIDESLENMTMRRAGRAHNDYLEIAVEAGAAGLLVAFGWVALVVWLAWKARHSPDRWAAWSGACVLSIIALQSITDYPLRNQTLLAVAALALLVLVRGGAATGIRR